MNPRKATTDPKKVKQRIDALISDVRTMYQNPQPGDYLTVLMHAFCELQVEVEELRAELSCKANAGGPRFPSDRDG